MNLSMMIGAAVLAIVAFGLGVGMTGLAAGSAITGSAQSEDDLIREYYMMENAVSVSPSNFIDDLQGEQNMLLVDLRSSGEYEKSHMVTAVNIPAVQMNAGEIVDAFSGLPEGKTVVTHCYSSYCMLARNVGKLLADNGIYVKHMTAGWAELESEYPQYLVNGTEPGIYTVDSGTAVCQTGEFTC